LPVPAEEPTVRTAQPRSLRQAMPGPYSTEHSAYEFNCREGPKYPLCSVLHLHSMFVFVLLEHCVCPGTFVERPWHPLIGPPQMEKKNTQTRPSSIRAGFGVQFCHQLGQICE